MNLGNPPGCAVELWFRRIARHYEQFWSIVRVFPILLNSLRLGSLSLKCLCRYRFDEHLLLSGINSKRIEDEPNGRANVIDALIVSPNGLLFELSIPDGSRNRRTSRGSHVRFHSRSVITEYPLFYLKTESLFIQKNLHFFFVSIMSSLNYQMLYTYIFNIHIFSINFFSTTFFIISKALMCYILIILARK